MNKANQIAWKWLIQQPPVGAFAVRVFPVDPSLNAGLDSIYSMLRVVPALPFVIERRAVLYSKAGCPKVGCVKSAIRDFIKEAAL